MNIKETTPGSADQSDTRKPATDEDLLAWSESDHITQDMIESMDARIDQDRGRIRSLEDKLAENERVRIRLASLLPLDLRDKKEAFVSDGRAETRPSLCVCGHSVLDHAPICKSCGHEKVIPSKCDFFTSSSGLSDEQIQRARVQLKPEACAEGHLLNGGAKMGCKACGKALGEKLHRTLRDENIAVLHENEALWEKVEFLERRAEVITKALDQSEDTERNLRARIHVLQGQLAFRQDVPAESTCTPIIVNGRRRLYPEETVIWFDTVAALAGFHDGSSRHSLTITYNAPHRAGTMLTGDCVLVGRDMVFNVAETSAS